ncbi:MAG TPA: hypothetical protein VFA38_05395, partial [Nitrospirales bacterium]|nr:hypothetical protein [Nitrospirales bacterium]
MLRNPSEQYVLRTGLRSCWRQRCAQVLALLLVSVISFGSAWAKSDGIVEPSDGQGVGAPPNATSPEIPGSPPESETGKTEEPKQPTAPGAGAAPEAPSSSAAAGQAEENRQKEAEEARRATELYLRNQNVFLRKGELMVEANT